MKKFLSVLFMIVICAMCMLSASASYAGTSIATAGTIGFDQTYSDSITDTNREDYYKINLASSGRLTLNVTSYMRYYSVIIYNDAGEELWKDEYNEWVSTTGKRADSFNVDLIKGVYYIKINGYRYNHYDASTGNYEFTASFKSANENKAEPNNSIAEAKNIAFDSKVVGQIAINDRNDYYAVDLASAGRITIDINSFMRYYCLVLYDQNGVELWKDEYNEWVSTTGRRSDTFNIDLIKGTYYLKVNGYRYSGYDASTGNYDFTVSFKSAGENIAEPNNSTLEAKKITFDKKNKGQIAINDRNDYYTFDISSPGRITININSYMQYYCLVLYNQDGIELWKDEYNEWVSTTGKRSDTFTIDLSKGTYYLKVNGYRYSGYDASTGNFDFKISFKSAGENIAEPNNSILDSKSISFNKTIKGQIAINDRDDYYSIKLTVPTKIKIDITSYMRYYCLVIYNEAGTEVWKDEYNEWISTTSQRKDTYNVELEKGTYYVKVNGYRYSGYDASTGNYNFTISPEVNVAKVSSLKATPSTSSIKLSWSKISGVTGYVVYKYNASTKKYEKIGTTKSTSYKFEKLKSGTAYKFRVRAYKKAYDKNYYGEYTSLSASTKPTAPTIKLSTSNRSATISWNKIAGAKGYVVYMSTSKNGTYSKIGATKNLSLKKIGLTKNKTYYFKVRAYTTVNGSNVYGAYSSVKSIKIK